MGRKTEILRVAFNNPYGLYLRHSDNVWTKAFTYDYFHKLTDKLIKKLQYRRTAPPKMAEPPFGLHLFLIEISQAFYSLFDGVMGK